LSAVFNSAQTWFPARLSLAHGQTKAFQGRAPFVPRGCADIRNHGVRNGCFWRRPAGLVLCGRATCVTAEWDGLWLKLMSGQRIISRSRLPWHGSDSPRRLAGRMVPPTSISGKSELNNHTFEPRLFEPKSRLPGNGILPAETKAPKRLRKAKETIAAT
jgi:hypothetical protein